MATRRSEWLASIKPILDKDEAKKDAAALAKELGDILEVKVDASPENLDELAKEFNAQLKNMGKQPIVFSEKTIKGIVSQFSMAITAGMKDGIDKSKLMLKDLVSLQEAYSRHQNASWKKTGKRVRSGFVNSAKGAFEYEPSDTAIKIGNNLRAITNEFNQATNWEEQYVALLKYIKAYEKLESVTSDPKSLEKWATIGDYAIQDLKDARPGIEHSLQNIFQVAYDKAVTGITKSGDIDVDVKLTPIKMIDAYDITGGKGHIEVEVKPIVKKAKKNETPNAFRGVHKPSGGEGRSISRALLGGDFWTDNDGKGLFLSSYGEESGEVGAKNLAAVFKPLNRLFVDAEEGGRGDAKAFNEIDQLKFLQHLFPDIENFINTADTDSRDYVQKYYNEMARQAGFDLFEVANVNEGADELATTLVPLQDRIIEWASKIPEYYDVEKFTPEMERDIISRQKGSSEKWYTQTIERLESQMAQAVETEDITEVKYLQELIPKVKEMYSSAMANFDNAIAQYGGYIEESVLQGLPEIISSNADGKLIPKFSADDLQNKIQEFVRLSKELDQIRDSEPNKKDYDNVDEYKEAKDLYDGIEDTYQQKIDLLYNQLINGLPNNLQNEIDNLLIDAVDGAINLDDVFNQLQPHLTYNDRSINGVVGAPSKVKQDKQDGSFEIVKEEASDAKQAVDGLNESLEKAQQLTSGDGVGSGTGDASSSELEAYRSKVESLQNEIEQKNSQLAEKDSALQTANNEKQTLQNDLDIVNRQNAELRERASNDGDAIFIAEQRANEAEEKAAMYDRAMTSMQEEMADLRGKLADSKAGGGKDESVNAEELKTLLSSIVYNVKIAHDDNDKAANKVAFDESTLEATLTKVFANILNPQTQQNDSEQTEKHWALESTLQTVKAVLDNIYTNTAKIGTVQIPNVDTITGTALDGRLTEIKAVLESINSKIAKGGVIATRGAVKQANAQPIESEAKVQAARSNMMKSLINDYKTMGKLAAQFANDGNLETQAMLENLKEEIARKRQSLRLTMDENKSLREKYSIAFDAEKRLLDAEKAQKEINAQNKADAKEAEASWKKQVKDAQRATGVNAATSAANSGDQTVLRAIGTEGISQDVENKAKELSEHIKTLRVLRDEIDKKGNQASDADRDKLSKQISKVKELKSEVDGYLKIHEKYSGDNVTDLGDASNFGAVGTDEYWNNITAKIKSFSEGKTVIKGLNADTGELTGTTKIAANTFAQWSATVDPLTGRLSMLRTGIKKTETIVEQITRKTKEIFTYFSGSSIIFKAFNELKKGVQYVRDIDLALTELKKVTDETEETYRKFLDTASKTAAKVGSTIKDVVSSTADWARLNI